MRVRMRDGEIWRQRQTEGERKRFSDRHTRQTDMHTHTPETETETWKAPHTGASGAEIQILGESWREGGGAEGDLMTKRGN